MLVNNGLMQGLSVAGHNGAARAHGFKQAPAEHKWVREVETLGGMREVDERCGDLKFLVW